MCVQYRMLPFLHDKKPYLLKYFIDKTCFYSVSQQRYFSKYWGDGYMERPPNLNF